MAMLSISDLSKVFDGFVAVSSLYLDIEEGERHAVIGPNGAGKTTFFNLITGLLPASSGEVVFEGERITGMKPHQVVRRGIARSFQRVNIFPELSVFRNVQVACITHGGRQFHLLRSGDDLFREETLRALDTVGLADDADTRAGLLAYGKQKQLELALALAAEPRLLLLDEPTAGMSPAETAEIIGLIGRIVEERGLTLLFTEHDMDVIFTIATRISVLHHGTLLATGTPDEVRENEEVQRVYLGGTDGAA